MEFTAEQQAHIDKLISERLVRERNKTQSQIEEAKQKAVSEFLADKGINEEKFGEMLESKSPEHQRKLAEAERLAKKLESENKKLLEANQQAVSELFQTKTSTAISRAIGDKADERQKQFVEQALMRNVKQSDDGKLYYDNDGKAVDIDTAVSSFLDENPFLKKPEAPQRQTPPPTGSPAGKQSTEENAARQIPYSSSGNSFKAKYEGKVSLT